MRFLRNQLGFTLQELVITILMLGLLAVSISPSGCFYPEMRLRTAAERLQSDLQYAQSLARQEGARAGLTFDAGLKKYTVVHTAGLTGAPDPLTPTQSLVFDCASDSRFTGITMSWSLPGGGNTLLFDSLGQPRTGSYALATSNATVSLLLNGLTATISVEAVTGRVSDVVVS